MYKKYSQKLKISSNSLEIEAKNEDYTIRDTNTYVIFL